MTAISSPATEKAVLQQRKPRTKGKVTYWPYLVPGLVGFIVVIVISLLWNVYLSFTKWNGISTTSPEWVGLDNYRQLMVDETFWQSFLHSGVFIFAMAIVPTILGLLISASLFDYIGPRFGNRTSSMVRAGFFLPQIIPISIGGLLWIWMLSSQNGVINNVLGQLGLESWQQNWLGSPILALMSVTVVLIWIQVGYTVVIFMSGLARADQAVHEAAALDGATWFQRFRIITINQLAPEIGVVLLTTTVAALKVFAPVYVMTGGGPGTATQVPAAYSYFNFITTSKVGYGAAVSTVLALIMIILALVILRYQNKQGENR
jgi:raffinose/stachyose/melibiose transport system permease protein